ncbi:MAG TPA: hypothetical protein VFE76_05395 [Myxococcales bacterium]|nr:hypothetical protein [Myxococcales bacterium]
MRHVATRLPAAAILAACGQGQGPAQTGCPDAGPAISNISVSSTGTGGGASFKGSARQGPNLVTKQFDPQEIQLFLSDVSECGGPGIPTRQIIIDVLAGGLPRGAIPGTYTVTNTIGPVSPPAFATFVASGMGELLNDPSGHISLIRVDGCVAEGSFEVTASLGRGGTSTISGDFVAPFCATK